MPFPAVAAMLSRLGPALASMFGKGATGAGGAGAAGGAAAAGGGSSIMPGLINLSQSLVTFQASVRQSVNPLQEMASAAQDAAAKMKEFSPAAAQVGRFEEVRELIRERDSGQRMAPEMMALAKERQEMLDNIRPIREFLWTAGMRFQRVMLAVVNKILDICQAIYSLVKPIVGPIIDGFVKIGEFIDWLTGKEEANLADPGEEFLKDLADGKLRRRRDANPVEFRR